MSTTGAILVWMVATLLVGADHPLPANSAGPGTTGAILGRVTEFGSDVAIPGATVTARNQGTGFERASLCAADGTYFVPSLPPGFYQITATHEEFEGSSVRDYPIRVGRRTAVRPAAIALRRANTAQGGLGTVSQLASQPLPREYSAPLSSHVEVTIQWAAYVGTPRQLVPEAEWHSPAKLFTIVGSRRAAGPVPRQRSPELTVEHLLVVSYDGDGQQRDWALIPDPRVLRAEAPGPTGELTGQVLHYSRPEFVVTLPDDPETTELRIYLAARKGECFTLELLGAVTLP